MSRMSCVILRAFRDYDAPSPRSGFLSSCSHARTHASLCFCFALLRLARQEAAILDHLAALEQEELKSNPDERNKEVYERASEALDVIKVSPTFRAWLSLGISILLITRSISSF